MGSQFPDDNETQRVSPPRETPAHLNCTAKRFIDTVLRGVVRQLRLAGVEEEVQPTLSFHFDGGRSQPEGGGRRIPGPVAMVNASAAAVDANCTAEQLEACADGIGGLTSLEGLAEFLTDTLENGVAKPGPEHTAPLGWGPLANAVLRRGAASTQKSDAGRTPGPLELGGGSGAGFQIICGPRGLATGGGGGGGGAKGRLGSGKMQRHLLVNETVGGGGGGGVQMFFPASLKETPWNASRWYSWNSGGGYGCGSCLPGEAACLASPRGVACGAKMDDNGNINPELGQNTAKSWRVGVLRRCYEAGKLQVIGGGGGGAGGAECCKAIPSLNFGFGFSADLKPPVAGQPNTAGLSLDAESEGCCPDLAEWNVTNAGQSSSGGGSVAVVRKLYEVSPDSHDIEFSPAESDNEIWKGSQGWSGLSGQSGYSADMTDDGVDPFAEENTGVKPPGGGNRRPTLEEMVRQQASRLHLDASDIINRSRGPECALPTWLNESDNSRASQSIVRAAVGTKEPEEALKFIYKYNPLQGHLVDGASVCGGWHDWCCICHSAQRKIACLPQVHRSRVDWFLTEDCCESRLQSLDNFVIDATPARNVTIARSPFGAWVELQDNMSDSYAWVGDAGPRQQCHMIDVFDARVLAVDPTNLEASGEAVDTAVGARPRPLDTHSGQLSRGVVGDSSLAARPVDADSLAEGLSSSSLLLVAVLMVTFLVLFGRYRGVPLRRKLSTFLSRPVDAAERGTSTASANGEGGSYMELSDLIT